jgi:hypothetical protein
MQIRLGSIWGWRWIFIVEGAVTIIVGFMAWFFLVDFPQRASFLDDYQREVVIERLNKDRGDGQPDQITREKVFMHLRDPKVWGFAFIVFLLSEVTDLSSLVPRLLVTLWPISSRTNFTRINLHFRVIINDLGFSVGMSLLLVAPPYFFTIFVTLITSFCADRIRHRTPFIFVHSAIAILGFALLATSLPTGIKLLGTFLAVAGANANQPTAIAFAQNNIISTSKRAVVSSMQIGFGAIGGIAASTVFRQADAPRYILGLALLNFD